MVPPNFLCTLAAEKKEEDIIPGCRVLLSVLFCNDFVCHSPCQARGRLCGSRNLDKRGHGSPLPAFAGTSCAGMTHEWSLAGHINSPFS